MGKTITAKTRLTRSTSNPTNAGGKVVNMAAPKNAKTADQSTKRLAKPSKK